MDHHYIECLCESSEHVLRVNADPEDTFMPLWLEIHLVQMRSWYERLWAAVKYVFGHRSKYGDFDTVVLDSAQAARLVSIIRQVYTNTSIEKKIEEIQHILHTEDTDEYAYGYHIGRLETLKCFRTVV